MPREAHGTSCSSRVTASGSARDAQHVAANGPNMHPAGGPTAPGRAFARQRAPCCARRLVDAVGFFAVCCRRIERETGDRVDLVWPGPRIGLESQSDATPGVDRLEVEGLDAECTVVGTRFVPL